MLIAYCGVHTFPQSFKGFSNAQKLDKLEMRGSNTCELIFEDVKFQVKSMTRYVFNERKKSDTLD